MIVWASSLPGILLTVALFGTWWWMYTAAEKPPTSCHEHSFRATPDYGMLDCIGCGLWHFWPRGAPQERSKLVAWAEAHGLGHWQEGRSVAFLEALRGTS